MNTARSDDLFADVALEDDAPLRDPREINREVSAQLEAERQANRLRKINAGSHATLLRDACRRFSNDPHKQLNYFLQKATLPAATGRQREVSQKTRTDFGEVLHRALHELREERCPVHSLAELGRAHGIALVRRWSRQENGASTIQTKLSFLRRFLTLVGKPDAVPRGQSWTTLLKSNGLDMKDLRRKQVLQSAKTWESKGLDPFPIFAAVALISPVVAIQMELQLAFGLRIMESFQLEPTVADLGSKLLITQGAKGGRARAIDFDVDPQTREWQRDVLERAKLIAIKHPKRRLSIPGKTLEQMRNHYNYLMRMNGITGKELGVTSHALRHQFAARRFAALSGLPAPAEGLVPAEEYTSRQDVVAAARQDVSEQLGHWRESITTAYLGSAPTLAREARRRIDGWLSALQGETPAADALRDAGVSEAWVAGRAGMGLALRPGEKLHLFVRLDKVSFTGEAALDHESRMERLRHTLALAVEFEIAVLPWAYPGRPDDGVEVLFNRAKPRSGAAGLTSAQSVRA